MIVWYIFRNLINISISQIRRNYYFGVAVLNSRSLSCELEFVFINESCDAHCLKQGVRPPLHRPWESNAKHTKSLMHATFPYGVELDNTNINISTNFATSFVIFRIGIHPRVTSTETPHRRLFHVQIFSLCHL